MVAGRAWVWQVDAVLAGILEPRRRAQLRQMLLNWAWAVAERRWRRAEQQMLETGEGLRTHLFPSQFCVQL